MTWPADDLKRIARSLLLRVNPQRADGTASRDVTVGFVIVDGDIYVRSMTASGLWYRRALANGAGIIRAGRVIRTMREVTFHDGADAPHEQVDAAYAKKYRLAGRRMIESITNEAMQPLTVRIDLRPTTL
ncbi:DUF2255 family protein [Actinoplanes sp. NPDC051513]|uniref:DUF2255 family protein n=1 Tax=Actinoplanes sp. NPDC051513 TaxID=3363908 RepID=UPI0037B4FD64